MYLTLCASYTVQMYDLYSTLTAKWIQGPAGNFIKEEINEEKNVFRKSSFLWNYTKKLERCLILGSLEVIIYSICNLFSTTEPRAIF